MFKVIKRFTKWVQIETELQQWRADYFQSIRNHYSCDYCSGNCGQCGWSVKGRELALQKMREEFQVKKAELYAKLD